jgi:hypothetical protein
MFNRILFISFIALLLVAIGQGYVISNKSVTIREKESIALARTDSVHYYHDRLGREVAEKRAIQASLKSVEASYELLSNNQKLLTRDIQLLPAKERKNLVTGTSLVQKVTVHVVDSVVVPSTFKLSWRRSSDTLNYSIHVADSTLTIDTLNLPNRIFLAHYRDAQKQLHIKATNSNPMFKTQDIDTIVPEEKKPSLFKRIIKAIFN